MESNKSFRIRGIGLMSGTSLDGLDIAYCEFKNEYDKWNFSFIEGTTIEYNLEFKNKLSNAHLLSAPDFWKLHVELGQYFGEETLKFIKSKRIEVDFIASHGHTIFHQPKDNIPFTCQIGDGARICAITNTDTVCDFRSMDLALGGQGAPLVPIGDKLLFRQFESCLNLGGIGNISFGNTERIAFDICPVNMVLNHISQWKNLSFDKDGEIGKAGQEIPDLRKQLNDLPYYKLSGPKSMGREWVETAVLPLLDQYDSSTENVAHTYYLHIVDQIAKIFEENKISSCLVSGGGALNHFLIDLLKERTSTKIIVPETNIINFKEAIVFAFLGALRLSNNENTLSSVTGASRNSISGCVYKSR